MNFVKFKAFTLAELLIALAILGVIATFTIPKVLTANQNAQNKAIAKEVAGMISDAVQSARLNRALSAVTKFGDLTPYINYVKVDTTSVVDDIPPYTTVDCSTSQFSCLRMHNGATIYYESSYGFGGTANTNAIYVSIDPDSKASTTKAVLFWVYYNGRLTTMGQILPGTADAFGPRTGDPSNDPSWFSWN